MSSTDPPPEGESENQKAARLRRERRNAKILAGGSDRLNKITSVNGRANLTEADRQASRAQTPTPSHQTNHEPASDPAEGDISQMFGRGPGEGMSTGGQEDFMRQMMAAMGDPSQADQMPSMGSGPGGEGEDPMQQMMAQMQQMLRSSGQPGAEGGAGAGAGGLPPGLAEMLGGQAGQQAQPVAERGVDRMWRLVHLVFALALGVFAAFELPAFGSEEARLETMDADSTRGRRVFWAFATAELVLQSTRYIADHGQLPPSGMLYKVGSFLPEPYAGYVRTFGRYSIILTAVVNDALVVIFMLGCVAWWRGQAS